MSKTPAAPSPTPAPTQAPKAPKARSTYVAKSPILHDGDFYQEGDEIELDPKAAKALGDKVAAADAE